MEDGSVGPGGRANETFGQGGLVGVHRGVRDGHPVTRPVVVDGGGRRVGAGCSSQRTSDPRTVYGHTVRSQSSVGTQVVVSKVDGVLVKTGDWSRSRSSRYGKYKDESKEGKGSTSEFGHQVSGHVDPRVLVDRDRKRKPRRTS